MTLEIGVGLWTFQSTAAHPRPLARLYRDFPAVARRVESLGFAHLWVAEHRFWYDAWCPAPLMPIAAAAASTERLRFGTAMTVLPQHDPRRFRAQAETVHLLAGGRLEVGVALGHRDAEFDGLGIPRPQRATRMERGLDALVESGAWGTEEIWVGGMAQPALERLGSRGLSALLPQTLDHAGITRAARIIADAACREDRRPGRIGVLRDVWVDVDGARGREWFLPRLARHYAEEIGAWWVLDGAPGFDRPELLERQVERAQRSAVVGTPDEVATELAALEDLGVDCVVSRLNFDFVPDGLLEETLELFSDTVLEAVAA